MSHKLALITVVYENYTLLADFQKSLLSQKDNNFHVFIVDLSKSKKNLAEMLHPLNNKQQLTVIDSTNKGYAYGINLGLKSAIKKCYEFFCILNNDIYFGNDFITNALKTLEKYNNSIIGGKIYYAKGFEYHKNRYNNEDIGKVIWYAGGRFDWNHGLTPHRGVDEVDKGKYDKVEKTEFVNGALMLLDKKVIDTLGYWDESYFLYFEDADYCARAKRSGIKLYFDPRIKIWHKNSQSTGGSGSKLQQKYQRLSQLRFGLKYAPIKTKLHLIKNYLLKKYIS
ncbi:MAG: glycosyltransferase family 2 protein [Cyanobacteria bacterium]|nr:glycosyltransferase family 2 protein [Cyanobacteriota bacterium]